MSPDAQSTEIPDPKGELAKFNQITWDGVSSLDRFDYQSGRPTERRIYQVHVDIPVNTQAIVTQFANVFQNAGATAFVAAAIAVVQDAHTAHTNGGGTPVPKLPKILPEITTLTPDTLGPWSVSLKYASRALDGTDIVGKPKAFIDFRATIHLKNVASTEALGKKLFTQLNEDIATGDPTETAAQAKDVVHAYVGLKQLMANPGVAIAISAM